MLHTLRRKRAIWRVLSIPWRQRAIWKARGIWVVAHANVWISHGLVPAARHANLGLAHREMLAGLGRRDREPGHAGSGGAGPASLYGALVRGGRTLDRPGPI